MRRLAAAVVLGTLASPSFALVRGTTEAGGSYVSGGVGSDEMATLQQERGRYPLAVLTAATGTGAYLSDIHIRITDQKKQPVLDVVMDGPWLYVDVPPGKYMVEANRDGLVKTSSVTVVGGAHEQATFYFDTHDQVEPSGEQDPAAKGN